MEILQIIILGIVQGITEWLPISSEGIISLILINFYGSDILGAINTALWLHLGTLFAAILYFRKDLKIMIKNPGSMESKFIIIATVFSVIVGGIIFFYGIEKLVIDPKIATIFIGIFLIITGLIQKFVKSKTLKKINSKDSYLVGILQGFSILPGISRSGITYSTLLLRKYNPVKAIKTSFIMGIPVVLVGVIYLAIFVPINYEFFLASFISFIVGWFSIKFMLYFARKIDFSNFCIIIGLLSFLVVI